MPEDRETFSRHLHDQLIKVDLDKHSDADALQVVAHLIDASGEIQSSNGLQRALSMCRHIGNRDLQSDLYTDLMYYQGNAHCSFRNLHMRSSPNNRWEWESDHLEQEVLHFRRCVQSEGFTKAPAERQCQVLTNLGNSMSFIGRSVESVQYRQDALRINSNFAMAQGNLGYGLSHYAGALFDPNHQYIFLHRAYQQLTQSLSGDLEPGARKGFATEISKIKSSVPAEFLDQEFKINTFDLGDSAEERRYRQWSLSHSLFLCTLNDLDLKDMSIAARDTLCLPSIVVPLDEGPTHFGYFNQMKQEFVSARLLLFEGVNYEDPHYSDREVDLYNTLDYPVYCLAIEKVKIAFRIAYSLFDKIAFFLNDYLNLKVPSNKVNFRSFWYTDQKRKKGIRREISNLHNWPLRGLFWLSKDLSSSQSGFKNAIEPDAEGWVMIRNHLEHKYLKVHDVFWSPNNISPGLGDRLAMSITSEDLASKTLHILKTVRAALIYLSLAVYSEELDRQAKRPAKAIAPGSTLPHVDDESKRIW